VIAARQFMVMPSLGQTPPSSSRNVKCVMAAVGFERRRPIGGSGFTSFCVEPETGNQRGKSYFTNPTLERLGYNQVK
jgi:hypothetical protein